MPGILDYIIAGRQGAQSGMASNPPSQVPAHMRGGNPDPMQGMAGTPGGPVQESPTMENLRIIQYLLGYPIAAGAGIGAGIAGGAMTGGAGAIPAMVGGAAAGLPPMINSESPNIRDVWLDQLRMKMQGR